MSRMKDSSVSSSRLRLRGCQRCYEFVQRCSARFTATGKDLGQVRVVDIRPRREPPPALILAPRPHRLQHRLLVVGLLPFGLLQPGHRLRQPSQRLGPRPPFAPHDRPHLTRGNPCRLPPVPVARTVVRLGARRRAAAPGPPALYRRRFALPNPRPGRTVPPSGWPPCRCVH